jgi:hypothetical protein
VSLALVRRDPPSREKSSTVVRGQASRLPWAWDGLVFGVPMHEDSPLGMWDIVNSVAPSVMSNVSWTRDNRGNTVADLDSTSYVEWADHPRHDRPSSELTAYVRLQRNGVGDTGAGVFCNVHTVGSAPWLTWGMFELEEFPDFVAGQITTDGGSTITQVSFETSLPSTQFGSMFLRWRSGSVPRVDCLGERGNVLFSASYASSVTGTLAYGSNKPIRLNTADDIAVNYSALYSQAMVWTRRLGDTEMQALVADPFGWYEPRRMTVGVSSPFPIFHSTTTQTVFHVCGYAMFATTGERDAMQAEVQAWIDAHPGGRVTASAHTVNVAGAPYALSAGQATPDLMDEADPPTGPHPGFTWSYVVESKELRDSFGALGGGSAWAAALEGSQLGEVTT